MKGSYKVSVSNNKVKYEFTIKRNFESSKRVDE